MRGQSFSLGGHESRCEALRFCNALRAGVLPCHTVRPQLIIIIIIIIMIIIIIIIIMMMMMMMMMIIMSDPS